MSYLSPGDEMAFFAWLNGISGVVSVRGLERELHIQLRSKRLSQRSLRELIALYSRYGGNLRELAQFANESNAAWFQSPQAVWYSAVFDEKEPSNPMLWRSLSPPAEPSARVMSQEVV